MAMDSHDDNQYKILIDTVNNNRNEKNHSSSSSESSSKSDCRVIPFGSVWTSSCSTSGVARRVGNDIKNGHTNSSRRKCVTLFKGITIEEFLENEYTCQLTAIDKLILKNKAAIAEDQMKKGRSKTNELSSSAAQKKENRKGAKKAILGSIIAAKRNATAKRVLTSSNCASNESNKCNGVGKPSTSGKSKLKCANAMGDKQLRRTKSSSSNKNEEKQGESNPKQKKLLDANRESFKMRTNLKKDSRNSNSNNKKPLELKRLRTNLGYQTRSGNKERLRSGKTRVLPTERTTEQPFRRPSKKLKPTDGNDLAENDANVAVEKLPLKRVKDETIDAEVETTYEKRRKGNESVESNNGVPVFVNGLTPSSMVDGLKDVKIENVTGMKRESMEAERPRVIEVKMNMNIVGIKSTLKVSREGDHVETKALTIVEPSPAKCGIDRRADDVESAADKKPDVKQLEVKQDTVAKESMFNALGLQSIERVQQKTKDKELPAKERENYTGTLKAVIKTDKGCRRIEMKPKECDTMVGECLRDDNIVSFYSKALRNELSKVEPVVENGDSSNDDDSFSMEPLYIEPDSDKMEYNVIHNNVPLLDSIKEADTDVAADDNYVSDSSKDKNKTVEQLVVPEKSSSFSIHPDRLCSDVCKYCFGKFGILDTPCHIAQLKNSERQNNILSTEPNLKMDTCLCDACFRFVDRRANRPPKRRKTMNGPSSSSSSSSSSSQRTLCAVQNCNQLALRAGKRKWWVKMGKKIANLSFDITKRGPFGLCLDHYDLVEMHRACGICKKRLVRNEMYSVRAEIDRFNEILKEDGFPISLLDNTFLCKYCHRGLSLRLTYGSLDRMSIVNREYYHSFRNEILPLYKYNAENSDSEISNSSSVDQKFDSDNRVTTPNSAFTVHDSQPANANVACSSSACGSKTDENKTAQDVGISEIANILKGSEKTPTRIELKFSNLNIGTLSNLNIGQNNTQSDCALPQQPPPPPTSTATQTSTSSPSPSTATTSTTETCNDDELRLNADFKFKNRQNNEPKNLERCESVILFDPVTKKLWQDLQKPYGNQSSFLRHLILMEKYWRNGALKVAENADPAAAKYINGMKSRVDSLGPSKSCKVASSTQQPIALAMPPNVVKPLMMPPTPPSITLTVQPIAVKPTMPSLTPAPRPQPTPTNTRHMSCPPPLLKLNTADKDSRRIFVDNLKPSPPSSSNANNVKSSQQQQQQLTAMKKKQQQEMADRVKLELEESIRKQREIFKMTRNGMDETKATVVSPPKRQNAAKSSGPSIPSSVYERFICTNTVPGVRPFKGATYSQARSRPQPQQQQQLQQLQQQQQMAVISKSCVPKLLQLNGYTSVMAAASSPYSTASQASQPQTIIVQTKPQTKFVTSPSTNTRDIINSSSSLIAKLPKALTVTQISQSQTSRTDGRRSTGAPFMVGEEPSVSVFREIQK